MVNCVEIADSYFLFDFLEISDKDFNNLSDQDGERLKYGARQLIKFWRTRIQKTERGQRTFIPFDLSDQCIGGLQLEKTKLGFKTRLVFTDKIVGSGVGISNLDELIDDRKIEFEFKDNEWLIGEDAIYKGLEWSLKELMN